MTEQSKVTDDRLITRADLEGLEFKLVKGDYSSSFKRIKGLDIGTSIQVCFYESEYYGIFIRDGQRFTIHINKTLAQLKGLIKFLEE